MRIGKWLVAGLLLGLAGGAGPARPQGVTGEEKRPAAEQLAWLPASPKVETSFQLGHDGAAPARVCHLRPGEPDRWETLAESECFPVEAGKRYYVRLWCKAKRVWALRPRVKLCVEDGEAVGQDGRRHPVKEGVMTLDGHRSDVNEMISRGLLLWSPEKRESELPASATWDWMEWHTQFPGSEKTGSWEWELWQGWFTVPERPSFYFGISLPRVKCAQVTVSARVGEREGEVWLEAPWAQEAG
jgi:hypothetical protein